MSQISSRPAFARIHIGAVKALAWFEALSTRRSALVVFGFLAVLYIFTAAYEPYHWDTYSAAVPAWRAGTRGTLRVDDFLGVTPWFVQTDNGVYSNRFPGVIFVAVPAYWIADALGLVSAGQMNVAPADVTAALAAATAMALLFLVFCRIVDRRIALAGIGTAALATGTWSVSAHALWTHGPAQLYLVMAVLSIAAKRYLPAGVALGFAAFTRPQLAIVPFVLGVSEAFRRRSLLPAAAVGTLSAVGLGALVYYNHEVFGGWTITGGYPNHAGENLVGMGLPTYLSNWVAALFSPVRGVFVYSPFLVPAILGTREAWRGAPGWARSSAVAGLAYLSLQLRINHYSGGDTFFSYRLPLEPLTLMAPLLLLGSLCWVRRNPTERSKLYTALVVAAALLQAGGTMVYGRVVEGRI